MTDLIQVYVPHVASAGAIRSASSSGGMLLLFGNSVTVMLTTEQATRLCGDLIRLLPVGSVVPHLTNRIKEEL
jgi:hypothetical protein